MGELSSVADYRTYRETGALPKAPDASGEPVADPAAGDAAASLAPEPSATPEADAASEAGRELAKRKNSLQDRIDKAVKAQREAERRAEDAERRLLDRRAPQAPPQQDERAAPAAEDYLTRAKPSADQIGSTYADYDAFIEDLTDWKLDERHAREQRASAASAATRAEQDRLATYHDRLDGVRKKHADFDAVIQGAGNLPVSDPMRDYFLESEMGPEVQRHLCMHPEECVRIAGLPPVTALAALGKIESRLEAATAGPSSVAPVTNAPDPIKPVGGRSTGASTADPSQINSVAEWQKRRSEFV
ncbi:MAG TPA: hypothetical protein VNJ04_12020 [Gemmatimonadaceae bacterium]|nr:hypothetical protein [Gemmatimonadaceae bacterium]